jgi:hypothetical protein
MSDDAKQILINIIGGVLMVWGIEWFTSSPDGWRDFAGTVLFFAGINIWRYSVVLEVEQDRDERLKQIQQHFVIHRDTGQVYLRKEL